MMRDPTSIQSRRRTGLRYTILLFIVFALIAGWTAFWKLAAGKAETAIEGWRARDLTAPRLVQHDEFPRERIGCVAGREPVEFRVRYKEAGVLHAEWIEDAFTEEGSERLA